MLAHYQNWQSLDQRVMSEDMPDHTHLANMRCFVALMHGWASVWTTANATYQNNWNKSWRGAPVEKLQMG